MPPPNKAKHKEVTKAYVKARLDEGATYKALVKETGVSLGTISNWRNETENEQSTKQLERGKRALTLLDYDNLAKATHINGAILDEIVDRINNGDLGEEDLKSLSRTGVEISKMYGITWDKVLMREGGIVPPTHPVSFESVVAMLLSKGQADAAAADRLKEERKAYQAMKDDMKGTIDV